MSGKRTERIQIQLTEDELASLDDWRFGNQIPSRAAAIRELMRMGLSGGDVRDPSEGRKKSGDYGIHNS